MIATVSTHVLKQIDKEQVLKPFPKPRENTVDLGSLIRSAIFISSFLPSNHNTDHGNWPLQK